MRKNPVEWMVLLCIGGMMVGGCQKRSVTQISVSPKVPGTELRFDADWYFHRGDTANGEAPGMDQSSWTLVNLPHDWSIEDLPGKNTPFDSGAVGGINTGYLVGGTAWYRKSFVVPESLKDKSFYLAFEGVYMNAEVWLNGKHLGSHPYGYTSFGYDIRELLHFGKENVIAVRVENNGKNSRWYSGSGIYRHVWLIIRDPVHVKHWGTFITTPQVSASNARVVVQSTVENQTSAPAEITILNRILDAGNAVVTEQKKSQHLDPGTQAGITLEMTVQDPGLWSPDNPYLYHMITEVLDPHGRVLDRTHQLFGVRKISWDTAGFTLNGTPLLLKGGCMHHDNGPLGAAAYDRAEERRVELMKASGFNAIRCAHNPPSPAFLNACDKLGILVIDEAFDMWRKQKNPEDYHLYFDKGWKKDVESMVLRDRNHPAVIMWSIGNEIPERDTPEGAATAKELSDYIRSMDTTRPVTSAVNNVRETMDPFFAALDICGYNYALSNYKKDHERVPGRVIVSTESFPLEAFDYWMAVLDDPWVIGDFVWTGYDYLGEASIGWLGYPHQGSFFPWNHAFCGDIDICGWKRPQSFYRDVLWKDNQVSLFVKPPVPSFPVNKEKSEWSKWNWEDVVADWNWKGYEGKPLTVTVYSSCAQAELFLNGRSLGKKPTNRATQFKATWEVPYQPGELKAVGYTKTMEEVVASLSSTGPADGIVLAADRDEINAGDQDLSYITVELVDTLGRVNPKADNRVSFSIAGPGTILAVANANPCSLESFIQPHRKAYHGRCLVIVKSTGEPGQIHLEATSEGITPADIKINVIRKNSGL